MKFIGVAGALTLWISLLSAQDPVLVGTPLGNVLGFKDKEYGTACFYGIPYAKPPIGKLPVCPAARCLPRLMRLSFREAPMEETRTSGAME